MTERGILIAFEGIDGTGKSTQIRLLADYLAGMGYEVAATREPTDGPHGRKLRSLFSSRHHLTPEEELRLFMDDRREHVRELILPELSRGKVVLTDRYYFSTAAYQGAAGHDPALIIAENEEFAPVPDLVLLLTMSPAESVHRIQHQRGEALNDFEREEGLAKVAAIFAEMERDCIARIDAARSADEVHMEIVAEVDKLLAGRKGFSQSDANGHTSSKEKI